MKNITRTELTCYSLLASAFVLAGMLLVQLQQKSITPEAEAAMVVSSGPITAMTARARNDEEALFILHNNANRLLIYRTDVRGDVRLKQFLDLSAAFELQGGAGRGGASGTNRRTR